MALSAAPQSPTARHWKNITLSKRAGVLAPLFSIYSEESIGIGEIPDLELLAKWCQKTGISLIQILPLNDTGWDFRPYDSQSAYAIDPMYLALRKLKSVEIKFFKKQLADLKEEFSHPRRFVNYDIKAAKMKLLWSIFKHPGTQRDDPEFLQFLSREEGWLNGYAAFKTIKEIHQNRPWWEWPEPFQVYDPKNIVLELSPYQETVFFHKWLAWQTTEQLQETVLKIRSKNILVMADMPFLVARDSADVWMNPRFFKLDREAGAPPDLYIAAGQRWGMPPYRWEEIEADRFRFLQDRIRFLGRYAHLYRIDHFVGLCRLWTIAADEPYESGGQNGTFDPADQSLWKPQGEKIIQAMLQCSDMLPCAEDLGVVPDCAVELLDEYQIPGSDIQRWMRDWKGDQSFQPPEDYRFMSMSSLSTHDMPPFVLWWKIEANEKEKKDLLRWAQVSPIKIKDSVETFYEKVLKRALDTRSVFSIQVLQDWLTLTGDKEFHQPDHRTNQPGKVSPTNWAIRMPFSLEQMLTFKINVKIKTLITQTGRQVA